MAIVKNVEFQGDKTITTNGGDISINQGTGELIVRKNSVVLVRVNSQGFVYSETNGTRRILIGAHPKDGHIIEAISDPGIDVIDELERG